LWKLTTDALSQISLEITEEEQFHIGRMEEEQIWQVHCPIVGCGTKLRGLGDLEAHYVSRHTATCSVCARMFPTTRLLNLHVSETHDSFFQAKVARNYPMVFPHQPWKLSGTQSFVNV
jgi:hypothetical protein